MYFYADAKGGNENPNFQPFFSEKNEEKFWPVEIYVKY